MKIITGTVISTKMTKTAVVSVPSLWMHPIYKKRVKRTKKYLVHDEANKLKVGDKVEFTEAKPISKLKRHKLLKVVTS